MTMWSHKKQAVRLRHSVMICVCKKKTEWVEVRQWDKKLSVKVRASGGEWLSEQVRGIEYGYELAGDSANASPSEWM